MNTIKEKISCEVEEWREITQEMLPHHGKLAVSSFGRVRTSENHILTQNLVGETYTINFSKPNGKRSRVTVARLVALAFIPNPENLPDAMHISKDFSDNSVENIKWVSVRERTQHKRPNAVSVPTGVPVIIIDNNCNLVGEYPSIVCCAMDLGVTPSTVVQHANAHTRCKGLLIIKGTRTDWEAGKISVHETVPFKAEKRKQVVQINKNGEMVAVYDGIMNVERTTGFCHSYISSACKGRMPTAYGYTWRYINAVPEKTKEVRHTYNSVVLQYDADMNVIGSFEGVNDAARKTGISVGTICNCCLNGKKGKGYYWGYENEQIIQSV